MYLFQTSLQASKLICKLCPVIEGPIHQLTDMILCPTLNYLKLQQQQQQQCNVEFYTFANNLTLALLVMLVPNIQLTKSSIQIVWISCKTNLHNTHTSKTHFEPKSGKKGIWTNQASKFNTYISNINFKTILLNSNALVQG